MTESQQHDVWESGEAYEPYVGRWSRLVAREFLDWLAFAPAAHWLDVGCGTGALSATILTHAAPESVLGIDPSEGFLAVAQHHVQDPRVRFAQGDAGHLPAETASYDAVVSGLVLNFISDLPTALAEMVRVTRPGGTIAAYVWDYAEKMELMRYFWDAAVALKPEHSALDEGQRFPLCHPAALSRAFMEAGLQNITGCSIDVPTLFQNFDDYWSPFLAGQFPAPAYAMSLPEEDRIALREHIRATLPSAADGSISLLARAWAVRGRRETQDVIR